MSVKSSHSGTGKSKSASPPGSTPCFTSRHHLDEAIRFCVSGWQRETKQKNGLIGDWWSLRSQFFTSIFKVSLFQGISRRMGHLKCRHRRKHVPRNCVQPNQPLSAWDVSQVVDVSAMFADALHFDQDLHWDTSSSERAENVFEPLTEWGSVAPFEPLMEQGSLRPFLWQ